MPEPLRLQAAWKIPQIAFVGLDDSLQVSLCVHLWLESNNDKE